MYSDNGYTYVIDKKAKHESKTCGIINPIKVDVATNGYQGGDYSYGSRASIEFEWANPEACNLKSYVDDRGFRVDLGGDLDIRDLLTALSYAYSALKKMAVMQNEEK